MWLLELNPGPLQEQVLLTAKTYFQPTQCAFTELWRKVSVRRFKQMLVDNYQLEKKII